MRIVSLFLLIASLAAERDGVVWIAFAADFLFGLHFNVTRQTAIGNRKTPAISRRGDATRHDVALSL